MKNTSKGILTLAALLGGVCISSATVNPQGWWHYGEDPTSNRTDSSGNGRNWTHAFSCAGSGNEGAGVAPFGVGGPLGKTGFISTSSLYWTPLHCGAAAMWNPWKTSDYTTDEWNPPPTNYVIEAWCLPEDIASSPGRTWFFASGSGDFSQPSRPGRTGAGGVYFVWDKSSGTPQIGAFVIGNATQGVPADAQIGDYVNADFTTWMHVAVVNDNGTNTFYVNGVPHGASTITNTIPNGNIFGGGSPGTTPSFHGWLDELRISTFAPGQFSTADLLLRPTGPNILAQPKSVTVWDGGAAPFSIQVALDTISSYQWQRNGANIPGANASSFVLSQVLLANNADTVRCLLTGGGITITSAVATINVVAVNADNVAAYQNAVKAESSLLAYFPIDGDTGATVANVKDASHNGLLEANANYDGRTNGVFGHRALLFNQDGDVAVTQNAAFDFLGGNGTIEAIVNLSRVMASEPTIFSLADGYGSSLGYAIRVSSDGNSLVYTNDAGVGLNWLAPASFIGRLTHVAMVFDHGTNVTAYANGLNLGTKTQSGFGTAGLSAWIGSIGNALNVSDNLWAGTVDELAIYGSALPGNTIAIHNSKFLAGTNQSPVVITTPPVVGSKTLLAGGAPVFTVVAAGTAPLSYLWTVNGVPIPGANQPTLALSHTTTNQTGTYVVTVSNPYSTNSASFGLTFVAPPDTYAGMVMNDNPSAFWRLDETSGTTAFDVAGGHDGTYYGNYASIPGVIPNNANKAIQFNAPNYAYNATAGARIEVPYSPVFNSGPFTIECFNIAFWDANDGNGAIVTSNVRLGSVRQGWILGDGLGDVNYDFILGSGAAQTAVVGSSHAYANTLVHQAAVYDGTNAYLYVNGVLERTANNVGYAPNPSNPLEIGVRNNAFSGTAWDGVIDEVAFYGYALSGSQISNHYTIRFVAPAITTQPVGVTNNELSTVTLTAAASGFPNTYQWYRNGVALDPAKTSFDGTVHYTGGVTSPKLTIAKPTTADAGQYHMVASNSLGNAQTIDVTVVLTIIDTTPPNVVSAASMGAIPYGVITVDVQFDKILDMGGADPVADPGTARNAANYTFVSPSGATVSQAELRKDGTAVRLTVSGLASTPGTAFTVKVANVRDWTRRASNAIPPAGQTVSGAVQSLLTGTADVDTPVPGTTYTVGPGEYEAEAGGNDIWNATDQFHYGYSEVSGDFDVSAQIVQVGSPGNRSGIMLRDEQSGYTTGDARFNYITWNPGNSLGFHVRETAGVTPVWKNPQQNWFSFGPTPNVWIRLKRVGTVTSAYYSTDGGNWNAFGTTTNVIADPAFLGLATCSGGNANLGLTKYAHYGVTVVHPKLSVSNAGGQLTISWTETGTLLQSTNVTLPAGQWTVVPGTSPYVVTPAPGTPQMYYRVRQ
jgi:hypothetical protein